MKEAGLHKTVCIVQSYCYVKRTCMDLTARVKRGMAKLQVGNAGQLRLLWSFEGELAVNVLGFLGTIAAPPSQASADAVGAALKAEFNGVGAYGSLCPISTVLEKVGIRSINTVDQPEFLDQAAGAPGTGIGDPLPKQTASVMTLRTSLSGKSNRGRVYWGGFDELQNDASGQISAAVVTATHAFLGVIATSLNTAGYTLAVISRPALEETIVTTQLNADGSVASVKTRHHNARNGGAGAVTVGETRDLVWDTQRRRNNGRGTSIPATFGRPVQRQRV